MSRLIQVWFRCDVPRCNATADALVPLLQSNRGLVVHDTAHPDGWSSCSHRQLCPEHTELHRKLVGEGKSTSERIDALFGAAEVLP